MWLFCLVRKTPANVGVSVFLFEHIFLKICNKMFAVLNCLITFAETKHYDTRKIDGW
jgi:hypothetical protein